MRERIVRVLRSISYSFAALGAARLSQTFENVATFPATRVAVVHFPRREHVREHSGDRRTNDVEGKAEYRI